MTTTIDIQPSDVSDLESVEPEAGLSLRETYNDLPESTRARMVGLLNQLLADAIDLHSQVKQAHWNVRGVHFQSFHELFDEVAEPLPGFADELAERVGMLGGAASGTVRAAAGRSRLPAVDRGLMRGTDAARIVAQRVAFVANSMRRGIDLAADAGDEVSVDLLTEIARELDKQLWFIESHLGF